MKIRLQADADLNRAIVVGVSRSVPEIDFQQADALPLENLADLDVLGLAAQQDRVLVSHDVNSMVENLRNFVRTQDSPGLVLIPQRRVSIGLAVESLKLLWEVVDSEEMRNRICLIPSLVIYS